MGWKGPIPPLSWVGATLLLPYSGWMFIFGSTNLKGEHVVKAISIANYLSVINSTFVPCMTVGQLNFCWDLCHMSLRAIRYRTLRILFRVHYFLKVFIVKVNKRNFFINFRLFLGTQCLQDHLAKSFRNTTWSPVYYLYSVQPRSGHFSHYRG
jgi:hypothetical protein